MNRGWRTFRRGTTLIELVLAMAVASLVLVGLGTAAALASRAMPGQPHPASLAREGRDVLDRMAEELLTATGFSDSDRTPNSVTFTVPDRNADGVDETIRYSWSGVTGDPLKRRYNGNTAEVVADNVQTFSLAYDLSSKLQGTVTVYRLREVQIVLQFGADDAAQVRTSVRILNAPVVAGP
ncbi:MAG: hypothetical protein D6788_05780 [Planctomycetota bacterium]|nr:MAG: hypothetical protein D6788_05780 [Planctomycetota bacterium]